MTPREAKLVHALRERVKELECLYGFSKLIEDGKRPLKIIFEKAVTLLRLGWQYPEVACARIVIDKKEYRTPNFQHSAWIQSAPIKAFGEKIGFVEVAYLAKKPQSFEGPFLKEERNLLDVMADRFGKTFEWKNLNKSLTRAELVLKTQNKVLAQKNLVLRELLSQVEIEKANIKNNIMVNLNQTVFPLLEQLRTCKDPAKHIKLILQQLNGLTSSFGVRIGASHLRMTPRELEICNLIKANLSTKQISDLLNLSSQTIDHHRKNIRRKLGLANQDVNLVSYLKRF